MGGEKEVKQIKRLERALESVHIEKKTEHKENQAKLEGESSNRCEARENLFAEVTISCRLTSDWKVAQGSSPTMLLSFATCTCSAQFFKAGNNNCID